MGTAWPKVTLAVVRHSTLYGISSFETGNNKRYSPFTKVKPNLLKKEERMKKCHP